MTDSVPCVLHEDEHLLVVNKPAGLNTHAPSPFAGEGLYEWLRHREPRWSTLAIVHRLDKETSGVMVFGKTPLANRSLTEQFSRRELAKRYVFLTASRPTFSRESVISTIVRQGDHYESRAWKAGLERAETHFEVLSTGGGPALVAAEPFTGRTHQIRVHAASLGIPVLGDRLYGGADHARVCLHAESLAFRHPSTGAAISFRAEAEFAADPRTPLRTALIDETQTNIYRVIHGASDGWPGWYVDRLGDFLLSQSAGPMTEQRLSALADLQTRLGTQGLYHKELTTRVGERSLEANSPKHILGVQAPQSFLVRENGLLFELRLGEGYSVGLFLDQRDNRRRLARGHVAAGFPAPSQGSSVLNVFAYTCGFSVCAAAAGAQVTSLDLSRKYLDWGRRNFLANGLNPDAHDFIAGEAFEWMRRLAKKGRGFNVVLLDPPTFSRTKERGVFQAEKHFGTLVEAAIPLVRTGGILFASCNAARLPPESFVKLIEATPAKAKRPILSRHFAPQPHDFPIRRDEPAHLKTLWMRIG